MVDGSIESEHFQVDQITRVLKLSAFASKINHESGTWNPLFNIQQRYLESSIQHSAEVLGILYSTFSRSHYFNSMKILTNIFKDLKKVIKGREL
ncbi:hypothetical protein FRX31_010884 [Thalictrum thalictroides]|uniref:Uncharacterized protein n=1 Tax=Thalictrum thalictroides TaxID=46969 RepID=A0A7J6WQ94_THATH|nr:hypothetical protein FRX31_010884 [Thalictrum thalictroides]